MSKHNTFRAEICEIFLTYFLNQENHIDSSYKKHLEKRKLQIARNEYYEQKEKARVMASEIQKFIQKKYNDKIEIAYWVPNSLHKNLPKFGSWKHNPTDVLLKIKNEYLGVSVKTLRTKFNKVSFRNPGIGTIESELDINLNAIAKRAEEKFIKQHNLSNVALKRKQMIRNNLKLKDEAQKIGFEVLHNIREKLIAKYNKIDQKELKEHIKKHWLNIQTKTTPEYIIVTVRGTKDSNYKIEIEEPFTYNSKKDLLNHITVEKCKDVSIIFMSNNERLFTIRPKWASQFLSSAIKFSAER